MAHCQHWLLRTHIKSLPLFSFRPESWDPFHCLDYLASTASQVEGAAEGDSVEVAAEEP